MPIQANLALQFVRGSTFQRQLTFEQPAGTPIDLTDFTAAMQIRKQADANTIALTLTTDPAPGGGVGNDYLTITALTGIVTINVPADITADIDPELYVWDLELYDEGDVVPVVYNWIGGTIQVIADVTRV